MLQELSDPHKTTGLKQSVKAVKAGQARKAFVAKDADAHVIEPFIAQCELCGVPVEYCETCEELGDACGIDVKAAVAVLLQNS